MAMDDCRRLSCERNKEKTKDKILYTKDDNPMSPIFSMSTVERGVEVLCAESPIDPYLMQFLERKLYPRVFPTHRCNDR